MSIDLKQMLAAGVHFGHKTSRWSPKMKPFIWGAKNHVHLIDVSKTALLLEHAGKFIKDVASTGGKFLFVGTKKPAQGIIERAAKSVNQPFVIHRWVGGTLSNYDQVKKAVTRLLHMRDVLKRSTTHYKKKELSMIQKELARLEKNVGGIVDFDYPPAAIILVDAKKEASAVKEAKRLGIPVVALVDTNTDPEGVTFVIPSNDDSPKAISFVVDALVGFVKDGQQVYEANKAKAPLAQPKQTKAQADAKSFADVKAAAEKIKETSQAKEAATQKAAPAPEVKAEEKKAAPAEVKKEVKAEVKAEAPKKAAAPKKAEEEKPKAAVKKTDKKA